MQSGVTRRTQALVVSERCTAVGTLLQVRPSRLAQRARVVGRAPARVLGVDELTTTAVLAVRRTTREARRVGRRSNAHRAAQHFVRAPEHPLQVQVGAGARRVPPAAPVAQAAMGAELFLRVVRVVRCPERLVARVVERVHVRVTAGGSEGTTRFERLI